jgi:uncharacterized protein YkwD
VASWPEPARTQEEQLLDQFQASRTAGGVTCNGISPSAAAPPLRLDTRLLCAARVLANDLELNLNRGLVDSQGRDTTARLNLVGYTFMAVAEYAQSSNSVAQAMQTMLGNAEACALLSSTRYRDIAVGSSGNAYVITLGALK